VQTASRCSGTANENVLRLEDTGREGARAYPMGLCGEKKRLTRVLGDFACVTLLISRSACLEVDGVLSQRGPNMLFVYSRISTGRVWRY
jgi:hypothetical protein